MDAVKTTKIIQRFKNEKNLLLVDNYELSNMWETWLKLVVDKIIVIDDFLNRSHNCDLFIDQNLHTSKKERNKINCKKFLKIAKNYWVQNMHYYEKSSLKAEKL